MNYLLKPMDETIFMKRALELAEKARGCTSPNPMVGAVIVKNNKIIGEGYHKKAGEPHAEIEAIRNSSKKVDGATLYTNLEPCCSFPDKKTPPCVDEIIKSKIKRVVCSCLDPFEYVNGRGIELLKQAKINVEVGMMEKEATKLNEVYFKYAKTKLPFITLKWATTLDGKIATCIGDSKWITGEITRKRLHEIRDMHDAILVGINTVIIDNPLLTVRLSQRKKEEQPIRIILDSKLKIPIESNIVNTSNLSRTIIVTDIANSFPGNKESGFEKKKAFLIKKGINIWELSKENFIESFLKKLGEEKITSVMVEGGSRVHTSFIRAKAVDKVLAFIAPKIIGQKGLSLIGDVIGDLGIQKMEECIKFSIESLEQVGEDVMITLTPNFNTSKKLL